MNLLEGDLISRWLIFSLCLALHSCNAPGFDPEKERRECDMMLAVVAKDLSNEEVIALYAGCNVDKDIMLPDTRSSEDRE